MIYRHGQPIPRVKVSLQLLEVLGRRQAKTTENNSFHARDPLLLAHASHFTPDLQLYVNLIAIEIFMEIYFYSWSAGEENLKYFVCITFRYGGKPEEFDTKNRLET